MIASDPHLAVGRDSVVGRHFEFDVELASLQVHVGRHFAPAQIDRHLRSAVAAERLFRPVEEQVQVLVRKPVALVPSHGELLWPTNETHGELVIGD